MAASLFVWLALAALLASATGQSITPTNWTSADADKQSDDSIGIKVSMGDKMVPMGPVLSLTSKAKNGIPPTGLSGPIFLLDPSSQLNLLPSNIALLSCDPFPGEISVATVFNDAVKQNVTSIVLYSVYSDWCNLQDFTGTYPWIYTTKNTNEATQLQNEANSAQQDNKKVWATVGSMSSSQGVSGTGAGAGHSNNGKNNNQQNQNPLGPSPNTAVAMVILYSITGIITALFLVIIVTGALRAHRHPERYGPRNITGRPRQSRARGLARAIVETLPIVKFGEQEPPKPTDVELAENRSNREQTTEHNATSTEQTNDDSQRREAEAPNRARESVEGGISAAINGDAASSQAAKPENLGCSICTEDFEAGQDQRVLPCDHRFHPACIDPWLLNVSGTCPMCRIDLRPETSRTSETGEVDENGNPVLREGEFNSDMAPPLGPNETAGEQQRMSIRRSIIIGLMGVGRPDRMTREERVFALRQLRGQHLARQRREQQASVAETPEEERSTRARLRNLLGVRTRRTGQADEQAQTGSRMHEADTSWRGTGGE